MHASGKTPQYARRISVVLRLAQDFAIYYNDCVRAQHVALRILFRHCLRLFLRQTQSIGDWGFASDLVFIDVRGMHLKWNPDFTQQLLPPRRRRS